MIFHKNIKKCQWGEPAWLAALAHFTAWLSRTAHALFPHKICNEFLWEGGLGCFQRSWLAVAAWTEISFSRPACLQKKTLFCIFIDTISSQSCYMPTKIELFMSVTLVCWLSWKKKTQPWLMQISVCMPLVYTAHHYCGPSATLLPVWLDMADHKKMVEAL